jgi:hypothetical protein
MEILIRTSTLSRQSFFEDMETVGSEVAPPLGLFSILIVGKSHSVNDVSDPLVFGFAVKERIAG